MNSNEIAALRKDYTSKTLNIEDVDSNPMVQFATWFDEAVASQVTEPNAMTIATATLSGTPSARVVLLKGIEENGFIFYTNYKSRKGQELQENPKASLLFCWLDLERQIRIEGTVEKIDAAKSDTYFHSRPRLSQLSAKASPQSQIIESKSILENKLEALQLEFETSKEIPRPDNWGGFIVKPVAIEFWQGRRSRLHDRVLYKCIDGRWVTSLLAP
jgi:pyridoxamine 5'-phosphate oxidase